MVGFLKKLKETTEKSIEKSVELGAKGYGGAKEAASKGYDKAINEKKTQEHSPSNNSEPIQKTQQEPVHESSTQNSGIDEDALNILKLRLVKGEISKEEFKEMKKGLEG
jgi:hypothetical protein